MQLEDQQPPVSETGTAFKPHQLAEISTAVRLFCRAGKIYEIRAFGAGANARIGYFDNPDALATEIAGLDAAAWNTFVTLNPCRQELLGRAAGKVIPSSRAAKDGEIASREWLLIDIDPVRPKGLCATQGEYDAALSKSLAVSTYLAAQGWPEPITACSGNGIHLRYRIDLPNAAESDALVNGCLRALAARFGDSVSTIDTAVGNAARISRAIGTTNRKGPNTPERPHRWSFLISHPKFAQPVPKNLLAQLAAEKTVRAKTGGAPPVPPAARVPVSRLMDIALRHVRDGEGRNNYGFWLFCQLRDNRYSQAEAEQALPEWVKRAYEAAPGAPYPEKEARLSLEQAYAAEPREPLADAPAVTSGVIQEIEKAIKQQNHFARAAGGLLYVFENGCYRPSGERFVEQFVKRYLENAGKAKVWSPELASRVVQYIATDAPDLWPRPLLDRLNVRNGLIDVHKRELLPHSPDFLSPVQIDAEFNAVAKCPAIDAFAADVFPQDSQHVPWELAAWLMLPDTSIQKAALAIGEGANGKSVFLSLLQAFLGKANVSALSLHKIEADKFAAARLVGKLANICPDLPTGALAGTSMFKAITGGDTISGERKFESSFEFRPYARLVFSANSAPRSDDASPGFFRRWLVLPFQRVFDERDGRTVPRAVLDARLAAPSELSGLLNRALDALPQIQSGRFTESDSTRAAWDEFRRTTDPLAVWLEANTVENPEAFIEKGKLREMYRAECRDRGLPILTDEVFTKRLRSLRPRVEAKQRRIDKAVKWCFVGIGLRSNELEPDGQREMPY